VTGISTEAPFIQFKFQILQSKTSA